MHRKQPLKWNASLSPNAQFGRSQQLRSAFLAILHMRPVLRPFINFYARLSSIFKRARCLFLIKHTDTHLCSPDSSFEAKGSGQRRGLSIDSGIWASHNQPTSSEFDCPFVAFLFSGAPRGIPSRWLVTRPNAPFISPLVKPRAGLNRFRDQSNRCA